MIKVKSIIIMLMTLTVLSGCSSTADDGVVKFVADVKKTSPGYAEKMPDIVQVTPVKFDTRGMRDPFETLIVAKPEAEQEIKTVGGPDPLRVREALEGFPLESLSMVGTLERNGKFFVLLKDKTGAVHLAGVGNYVGENAGKIDMITEKEVVLTESMPDGKGGWRDHKAKIPFTTVTEKETAATDRGTATKERAAPARDKGTTTRDKGAPKERGTGSARQGRGE